MNTAHPSQPTQRQITLRFLLGLLNWFVLFFTWRLLSNLIGFWQSLLIALLIMVLFAVPSLLLIRRLTAHFQAGAAISLGTTLRLAEGRMLAGVLLLEALVALLMAATEYAPYSTLDLARRALGYQAGVSTERTLVGMAFSADGRDFQGLDYRGHLLRWSPGQATEPQRLALGDLDVREARFAPDGQSVALLLEDDSIQIRRSADGALLRSIAQQDVGGLVFSADGSRLAAVGYDQPARAWRVSDGQVLQTIEHQPGISAVAFAPDNTLLVHTLPARPEGFALKGFSADGRRIALGSEDGRVQVLDTDSGRAILRVQAHPDEITAAVLSPDGSLLATSGSRGDKSVRVWRVADGRLVARFLPERGGIRLAFAPDQRTLAVSGTNWLTLWRMPEQP